MEELIKELQKILGADADRKGEGFCLVLEEEWPKVIELITQHKNGELLTKLEKADKVFFEIDQGVINGVIDSRSKISDARLECGNPHKYEFNTTH